MKHQRRKRLLACASLAAMVTNATAPAMAATVGPNHGKITTPIKHVIIIVGENRTFDHLFATYRHGGQPAQQGHHSARRHAGPEIGMAEQYSAVDSGALYTMAPGNKKPYTTGANNMPPIMTGGAPQVASNTSPAPFATVAVAAVADYGLETKNIVE